MAGKKKTTKAACKSTTERKDQLLCGLCGQLFDEIQTFIDHKRRHDDLEIDAKIIEQQPYLQSQDDQLEDFSIQTSAPSHSDVNHIEVLIHPDKGTQLPTTDQTHDTNKTKTDTSGLRKNQINKCDICGWNFKTKASLKVHRVFHSDDRPYVCKYEECGASFKTKGSLTRHDLRHTDKRPFRCKKCDRSFRESGALRRHERAIRSCESKSFVEHSTYGKTQPLTQDNTTSTYININLLQQQDIQLIQNLHNQVGSRFKPAEVNRVVSDDHVIVDSEILLDSEGAGNSEDIAAVPNKRTSTRIDPQSQCIVCQLEFDKKTDLQSHLLTHVNQPSYPCDHCEYVAESRKDLTAHTTRFHLTEVRQTTNVSVSAAATSHNNTTVYKNTDRSALYDALTLPTTQNEESTNPMRDGEINEYREERGNLGTQQQGEDSITIITCNTGEEHELQTDNNFTEDHLLVREDIKQAVRSACKAIQQLILLESDVPIHIRKNKNCPVCQKSFKANSYLQNHLRIHTGERPFKCKECFKDFTTMDTFRKHMLSHSNERQYKCGECGKLFKRISHVKEHLRIHSNDRPYSCDLCKKSFRNRNTWKVHMRTHTAVLPWLCKICSKSFREKASLVRHIRIHTGERPFKCKYCGKTFAEQSTVNRHLNAKVPCRVELAEARSRKELSCHEDVVHELIIPTVPIIHDTAIPTVHDRAEQDDEVRENIIHVMVGLNQHIASTSMETSQTVEDNSTHKETGNNVIYVSENINRQINQTDQHTIYEESSESSPLVLYETDVILLNNN